MLTPKKLAQLTAVLFALLLLSGCMIARQFGRGEMEIHVGGWDYCPHVGWRPASEDACACFDQDSGEVLPACAGCYDSSKQLIPGCTPGYYHVAEGGTYVSNTDPTVVLPAVAPPRVDLSTLPPADAITAPSQARAALDALRSLGNGPVIAELQEQLARWEAGPTDEMRGGRAAWQATVRRRIAGETFRKLYAQTLAANGGR